MAIVLKNFLFLNAKRLLHSKINVELDNFCTCSTEYIVIGLLLFLILLLGGLVTLIIYILMQEINYTLPILQDVNLDSLSVYCEDLSLSPDEDFDTFEGKKNQLTVSVDKNQKYLCSESHLSTLLNKMIEKQLRLRQSKGLESQRYMSCGNTSLIRRSGDLSVSFYGITHHQSYIDKDGKIHWDKHAKHSYTNPLINYDKGEIIVPEGRTYFVYASVHFNITTEKVKKNRYNIRRFTLRLCREVWGYEQTLLVKTKLFSKSNESVTSSLQVTGILHLNRNESIYVKVSNANQLILNSRGNTFGIYPM